MNKTKIDVKLVTIVFLSLVILVAFSWVGYGEYQKTKQRYYLQGINDGRVLEQRNVLSSVQATGFYTLNVAQGDQQGAIILKPVTAQAQR